MNSSDIYGNIAERTQGCIYAGVVGPVRTGKSTFIKRFMDLMVLPNVDNLYVRQRVLDELPQSGSGKTITTTEPKFVPAEAVTLTLPHNVSFKVRMVDCVGYLVPGAMGHEEEGKARMVRTPWSDEEMTFAEAAETGTLCFSFIAFTRSAVNLLSGSVEFTITTKGLPSSFNSCMVLSSASM